LTCQKAGVDFKLPTVQPVIIGQVTNSNASTGLSNVRVEACKVNNNGTSTIDTASGLCAGWISSVNRTGAGATTVNFISGTFSSDAVCTITATTSHSPWGTIGSTSITVQTTNASNVANDVDFMLICVGKR
jgi:hypothetical protein